MKIILFGCGTIGHKALHIFGAEKQGIIEKTEPYTTSLMYALGDTIYQSYGNQTNIKITTREDLDIFEGYVLMRQKRLFSQSTNNDLEG